MEKIQKRCNKCGKMIEVIPSEFCCPLCGEFFASMDNEQILNYHLEAELSAKIEEMKADNKWSRSRANKENAITWLKVLGWSWLGEMGLCFLGLGMSGVASIVWCIIMLALFACVVLAGPMIPVVNYFRFKKKLNEDIERLKREYEDS